jgi:aminomethyltransferase
VTDEPIRSVLYDVQAEQGAVFEDYDGWIWTLNLGDSLGEYAALRDDVVMWDVYGLVKWDVRGADAVAAVQRVFTNAIGALQPGQVRYGAIVDEKGALVDDGTVFRHDGDHLWVMTNGTTFAGHLATVTEGMDVTVENRLHAMPLISVQGPRSREVLQGLTDLDLAALPYFRFATKPAEVAGIPAYVLHTGFSGELGFELIPTERANAPALWTALGEAGVRPVGFEAVEIARVEAGLIIHEQDYMPGEQTPYDVGLGALVKLDDADSLLARDSLSAIAADPPNRFVTLRLSGGDLPELGADVLSDGEVVGCLTSPVESPRHGLIGLARVRSDVARDGASVEVAVGEATVDAVISHATVHDPDKLRVRA